MAELNELDGLCKQAKDAAAAGGTAPIARYAPMCDRRIAQMRERASQLQANGGTTREAEMLSDNVHRMLVFGRQISTANAPANPPKKKD
jgi:predicted Zn-dependent protease